MTSEENNDGEHKNVNDDEVVDLVKICYPTRFQTDALKLLWC